MDADIDRTLGRTWCPPKLTSRWLVLILILLGGCVRGDREAAVGTAEVEFADGLSAEQILRAMRDAYAQADTYQDQAVLYLSYTINGQSIQEQQPWNLTWEARDDDSPERLAANWYNAELRANGRHTACFVYDIDSGNLDGQWLVVEGTGGPGLRRVLSDSIARHFCAGYSEIPLDSSPQAVMDQLIPPTVGWLTGELAWPLLGPERRVSRLKDAKVDEQPCFHLRIGGGDLACELWIDQASHVLRQMTLPTRLLDPLVATSKEVNEVQFFARMHGATFSKQVDPNAFALTPPRDANAVQQFVAVPEVFPCERVGSQLAGLPLFDEAGNEFQLVPRTPIALVWLSGLNGPGLLGRLNELREQFSATPADQLLVVVGDEHMAPGKSGLPSVDPALREAARERGLKVTWLYDPQLQAARKIKLTTLPAAIVVGPTRTLEYARPLSDPEWGSDLKAAMQRTARGESVSREMTEDYQQYVERYQKKLQLVSAERLIQRDREAASSRTAGESLVGERVWSNTELARPGNLYLVPTGPTEGQSTPGRLLAFDGWRSVVELDFEGNLVSRQVLELPEGEAVSRLRWRTLEGETQYAVFSPVGRAVYLFDRDWRPQGVVADEERDSILDCGFAVIDGQSALVVAFQNRGLAAFDVKGNRQQTLSDLCFESLAIRNSYLWGVVEGTVCERDLGQPQSSFQRESSEFQMIRVTPAVSGRTSLFGVGVDRDANWYSLELGRTGTASKPVLIGSQLFDSPIEPLIATGDSSEFIVAAADTFGQIHLISNRDDWTGRLECEPGLTGVTLQHGGQGVRVFTASPKGITCWQVR